MSRKALSARTIGIELNRIEEPFYQTTILFTLGWWVCFFIHPMWYVPGSSAARWWTAAGLFLIYLLVSGLFRYIAHYSYPLEHEREKLPADAFFFTLLFGTAFLLHLPFLNQPILSGLDTIDHAAVPAVVGDKIRDALTGTIG